MSKYIVALFVGLLFFVITFKVVKFNPKEYLQGNYYTYTCQGPICNVYLSSSIGEESNYIDLYSLIENAPEGQTIRIHLSGNGGQMSAVYHLANAIAQSKAEIDTIVEGPVYSAHAFITMLGHKIIIMPNSQFLFHLPGVQIDKNNGAVLPDQSCILFLGKTDRGQDLMQKCLDLNRGEQAIFDRMFKVYIAPFLTTDEQIRVYQGYDVYIDGLEMQKRIPH